MGGIVMKTIEERAKKYSLKDFDGYYTGREKAMEEGYIAGATEQKTIDEAIRLKKCDDMTEVEYNREVAFIDWFYENSGGTITHSDAIEWARKEVIEQACEWLKENIEGGVHPQSAYGFVEKFRKAIEE